MVTFFFFSSVLCIQDTKLNYRKFRALFLQELVDNLQLGTEKRHTSSWTVSRTLWVYQTGTFTNSKWLIHHFSVCSWGTPWKLAAETDNQAAKHLKEQIHLTSPVPVNGQIYARTVPKELRKRNLKTHDCIAIKLITVISVNFAIYSHFQNNAWESKESRRKTHLSNTQCWAEIGTLVKLNRMKVCLVLNYV